MAMKLLREEWKIDQWGKRKNQWMQCLIIIIIIIIVLTIVVCIQIVTDYTTISRKILRQIQIYLSLNYPQ